MRIFKKLQENSLYWRYRFITRRWLALKRWWRERRAPRPRVVTVRYRGMSGLDPYRGSGASNARGAVFVLILASVWTAMTMAAVAETFALGLLRIVVLVALTYLFVRFW